MHLVAGPSIEYEPSLVGVNARIAVRQHNHVVPIRAEVDERLLDCFIELLDPQRLLGVDPLPYDETTLPLVSLRPSCTEGSCDQGAVRADRSNGQFLPTEPRRWLCHERGSVSLERLGERVNRLPGVRVKCFSAWTPRSTDSSGSSSRTVTARAAS